MSYVEIGAQARRFLIWDMRQSGDTMRKIAERFCISIQRVRTELMAMEVLRVSFGDELLIKTRPLAEMFDLEPSVYRELLASRVHTVDQLVEYMRTGNTPKSSYVRNIGPVTFERIATRLIELSLAERTELLPAPILLNLPDKNDWQKCLGYWGHRCAVCGCNPDEYNPLQQDHWVPRCMEICPGTIVTNIVPLCKLCNSSKSGGDPYSWLVSKLGKREADRKMREVLDYFDWWRGQGRE
jgi:hypothetical protein